MQWCWRGILYFSAVCFPFSISPWLCFLQTPPTNIHTQQSNGHKWLGFLEMQVHSSLSLLPLRSSLLGTLCAHIFTRSCSCYSRPGSWQPCSMVRFPTPWEVVRVMGLPTKETPVSNTLYVLFQGLIKERCHHQCLAETLKGQFFLSHIVCLFLVFYHTVWSTNMTPLKWQFHGQRYPRCCLMKMEKETLMKTSNLSILKNQEFVSAQALFKSIFFWLLTWDFWAGSIFNRSILLQSWKCWFLYTRRKRHTSGARFHDCRSQCSKECRKKSKGIQDYSSRSILCSWDCGCRQWQGLHNKCINIHTSSAVQQVTLVASDWCLNSDGLLQMLL